MLRGTVVALVFLTFSACNGSGGDQALPAQGPVPTPTPTIPAPELPWLTSTVSDCSSGANPCGLADFSAGLHTISPEIFGDGMEWQQFGQNVLAPGATLSDPGVVRSDVQTALKGVGLTLLRYPGGTLADMFHWAGAVGPISGRQAQLVMDLDAGGHPKTDFPYFGPDEFASYAAALGTEILLTVNIGTGTAQEAAGWITHWEAIGIRPKYVEIGNEMYLPGPGGSFPTMTPLTYAGKFDAYAQAIHAVDPTLKLGVIGTMETSFWCAPTCSTHPWNEQVLSTITQKADFLAVHNHYAPGTDQGTQAVFESMLSHAKFARFDNFLLEQDVDYWAKPVNQGLPLAITEHASFFLSSGTDFNAVITMLSRNQTLAAALFSALSYQGFVQDSRMLLTNHINPLHFLWQAPITLAMPDWATWPQNYNPNPILSAFGQVFKAYRELAAQTYVAAPLVRVPTIATAASGLTPAVPDAPLLDAVAAKGAGGKGWFLLVNRSLTTDYSTSIVLKNLPAGATILEIDELTSAGYEDKNIPGPDASKVHWTPVQSGRLPAGASFGLTVTVPKFTLLRLRLR